MRASLHTIGCRLNQAETAVLADRLEAQGYVVVPHGEPTDLFVLNTCSVTEEAERVCRYEVRRTLRRSPHAFVAITGCYAQTGSQALARIPGTDLVVGGQYKMHLPDYLPAPHALRKQPAPELLHTRTIDRDDFVMPGVGVYTSVRANLKIQDGCNFMCSFCIIPLARGHERSRRVDDVMREADGLAARGHRELVLTGVNIGRYEDGRHTLVDLIKRLESIAGVDRIRISSIEPTTISEALLDYMATSRKLCRYLHIPLQSGDDGILQAMHRHYTVREFTKLVERASTRVPDLGLGTDLLVGFPGEADSQFANTLAMARDLPFAYFHVFGFSKRPGTAATRLKPAVHSATIRARCRSLSALSRSKRLAFAHRYTGQALEVLFEGRDKSLWTGFTDNYLRVGVTSDEALRNQIRPVTITGAMDELAVGAVA